MIDRNSPVFYIEQHTDFTTIRFLQPQLTDSLMTDIITPELNDLVDQCQTSRVVFNLEAVEYLSSAALKSLLIIHDKLKRRECHLSLCHLQPLIESIFRVSHLDEVFQISDDLPDASGVP